MIIFNGDFVLRKIILLSVFLVLCSPSWAGFIDGAKLHEICHSKDKYERDFCVAYIIGLWDGQAINWRGLLGSEPIVCIAGKADIDEIVNIVVGWLERSPSHRVGPTTAIAALALSSAYPCGD